MQELKRQTFYCGIYYCENLIEKRVSTKRGGSGAYRVIK